MLFINKLFNSIASLLYFINLQLVIPGRTWILLYLGRTVYKRLWVCLALYTVMLFLPKPPPLKPKCATDQKGTLTAGKSETAPLPFPQRVSLPIITDDGSGRVSQPTFDERPQTLHKEKQRTPPGVQNLQLISP